MATGKTSQSDRVPPISLVQKDCINRILAATSSLFRPFDKEEHLQYAELFVSEVIASLKKVSVSATEQDAIMLQVVKRFVSGAEEYEQKTNMFSEMGFMFDLIAKEARGHGYNL